MSWLQRRPVTAKVVGSSPIAPANMCILHRFRDAGGIYKNLAMNSSLHYPSASMKRLSVLHLNPRPRKRVCFDAAKNHGVEFIDFPISYEREPESDLHIMHSLAGTPARYVELLVARASALGAQGSFLVLNPRTYFRHEMYALVVKAALDMQNTQVAVIASSDNCPLAYFFGKDSEVFETAKLFRLRFLSSVSAALDAEYLRVAIQQNVELRVTHVSDTDYAGGWLAPDSLQGLYSLTTLHALSAWRESEPKQRIAVMPYHAGDVLFFLKAALSVPHQFTTLLVHEEFADIVRRVAPDFELILVKEGCPERGPNSDGLLTAHRNREDLFFHQVLYPYIPQGALFYWFRMSKDYSCSKGHMVDQWRHALSHQCGRCVSQESRKLALSKMDKSVLLHFDGGWLMKVYPQKQQRVLIELLQARGYRVSVVTNKPVDYCRVQVRPFRSLALLEEDIRSHAIFVGMDSFPVHFATHILTHPSICLFSSTKPENSDASIFSGYRFLQSGLRCSPCNMKSKCDKYNAFFCKNFAAPEAVVIAIDEMFQLCYEGEVH